MKCPECQFENRERAKFCKKCGTKLELTCPSCGHPYEQDSIFCDECGHNLTLPSEPVVKELSFDEKIDKIQRYLPKGLTEKILSQRDKIEGERKQVTIMFCDMEGFTSLTEKLGPEESYVIMDQIYEILIHKVHDYEGTVNEMTGDGIMALFGAPIALEYAPQRAVRSAHAIQREMVKFSDKLKGEKEAVPPVKMRIGIHTGPVVVGTLGNDLRVEFKAVGDTVNLASRMEGLAEAGATYVTEETFRLTEGFFRFEALGPKQVKGRKESVNVYRLIAPSTRRTRFDVSAERGLTPFMGRERELDVLLEAFERAKAGRGQAISITAEAGVGKSRLLYEFRKAVSNEDITFLEGKCLSYSSGVAYYPVIDILKANFNIAEGEGDSEIRDKIKKGLKAIGAEEASTLPYLLELLSVKDSGIEEIAISPEAKKARIIEALNRNVLKGSELRPVIMAVEDLHWIDESSEERFKNLLDSISGARVFLIFTYRPEFVHTWGARSYHSQVNLNRLSNRESLDIVSYLLDADHIERDLEDLILEKTEGVPFFIEEFLRSLKELNIIERINSTYRLARDIRDVTIPSTIYDVIMARVDSLPEGAKEVLQTGSVIEREFSHELIKGVMALPEQELLSQLSVLKDSELLYERGIYPQSTYVFKHALTQEVVYSSLLAKRKKQLHGEIGNAIEELYKDDLDEHYEVLAEHYSESENYEKGAEYANLAAKKSQKAASYKEAIYYAKKGILCFEKLPKTDDIQEGIIDARTMLSGYCTALGRVVEAKEAVSPVADLALELKYQKKLPAIYTAMALYHLWVEENYSKGFQYSNEAINISEKVKDYVSLYSACYYLGITLCWNCAFEEALWYLKRCLDLSKSTNNLVGISLAKSTSAHNYIFQGRIDSANKISKESLVIAKQSGDIYCKGIAHISHGVSCHYKGLFDEAESNLLKGLAFCEKTAVVGWGGWGAGSLGFLYSDIEEYKKAEHYFRKAISIFEGADMVPSWCNAFKECLLHAKVLNHDRNVNLNALLEYYGNIKFKVLEGWIARYIGEILLNIDNQRISEAEDWIKKAIEMCKMNSMTWELGRAYALYAELLKRKIDQSKAKENLIKAIDNLKECGADGWVKRYEEEMASLS
ncbi:MAG: AAA family ATPase [Desulfobacteraceae bacterium]|nr:MAG: AAA family ATPase [Desulfobacteraceae bacterium]